MRVNDGRVVPNFIYQAVHGKPLTVYGNGKQTRSFCYVNDLLDGIYKLMRSSISEPVNLGNPGEFTILEFAKLVIELTATKSKIAYHPLPQDDPKQRRPNISKARKLLHWQPRIQLKEGLDATIQWFKNQRV